MADTPTKEKQAGKGGLIVTMAALTVLGAVGGGLVGKLVVARLRAVPTSEAVALQKPSSYTGEIEVKEIPAIVTDLADGQKARVRLQVAIVYAKKSVENPTVLAARIGDDIIAFVKTLSLVQLQGASGLQNLREDLNERAALRSQGAVREVIIEALVTQ